MMQLLTLKNGIFWRIWFVLINLTHPRNSQTLVRLGLRNCELEGWNSRKKERKITNMYFLRYHSKTWQPICYRCTALYCSKIIFVVHCWFNKDKKIYRTGNFCWFLRNPDLQYILIPEAFPDTEVRYCLSCFDSKSKQPQYECCSHNSVGHTMTV